MAIRSSAKRWPSKELGMKIKKGKNKLLKLKIMLQKILMGQLRSRLKHKTQLLIQKHHRLKLQINNQ
jgi:hypothetical protein